MTEKIGVSPRQRQTYDAAFAVTEGGTVRWTGVLKVAGVDFRDAQSDLNRLADLKVLTWERVGNSRRIQILVQPDGLVGVPARIVKYNGNLHQGAIARTTGLRGPGSSADMNGSGIRMDSGAFSKAFIAAFGPGGTYGGPVTAFPVKQGHAVNTDAEALAC